jgi:hypothetical protein
VTTFGEKFNTFSEPRADSTTLGQLSEGVHKVQCRFWSTEVKMNGQFNHYWLRLPRQGQSDVYFSAFYLKNWGNDIAKDDTGAEIPDCS